MPAVLRGGPGFQNGILDKAEAGFLDLGHRELGLGTQLQSQRGEYAGQLPQLAGIAARQHHTPVLSMIAHCSLLYVELVLELKGVSFPGAVGAEIHLEETPILVDKLELGNVIH